MSALLQCTVGNKVLPARKKVSAYCVGDKMQWAARVYKCDLLTLCVPGGV